MSAFDQLPHDEQLQILLEVARAATAQYELSQPLEVKLINLSENATYSGANGGAWQLPTSVIQGRIVKFGVRLDF